MYLHTLLYNKIEIIIYLLSIKFIFYIFHNLRRDIIFVVLTKFEKQ